MSGDLRFLELYDFLWKSDKGFIMIRCGLSLYFMILIFEDIAFMYFDELSECMRKHDFLEILRSSNFVLILKD